jgi:hypothetical protein
LLCRLGSGDETATGGAWLALAKKKKGWPSSAPSPPCLASVAFQLNFEMASPTCCIFVARLRRGNFYHFHHFHCFFNLPIARSCITKRSIAHPPKTILPQTPLGLRPNPPYFTQHFQGARQIVRSATFALLPKQLRAQKWWSRVWSYGTKMPTGAKPKPLPCLFTGSSEKPDGQCKAR